MNDFISTNGLNTKNSSFRQKVKQTWRKLIRQDESNLRETLEELIEEVHDEGVPSIESDERVLLGNVLNLRDLTASDLMVPRADIVAVDHKISAADIMATMVRTGLSKIPVYKNNLDDIIGMVHMKDMLAWSQNKTTTFKIQQVLREVLFISPSMRTLDLLLQMRQNSTKLALVVDEYGGIDGLVTLSNLIEEIIGDIQSVHDFSPPMKLQKNNDGSIIIDARYHLDELTEELGLDLTFKDLDDDIDTIGGLVGYLAGHVPAPGELVRHPAGFEFEIIDADPRRVKRLLIRPFQK